MKLGIRILAITTKYVIFKVSFLLVHVRITSYSLDIVIVRITYFGACLSSISKYLMFLIKYL